ncbi:MAG TPA: class I SAM-dependent methyltransferase [Polyangiaceae bacterium]|nr:class I SAM-dependent methyltransferase [Polyangiaceae bacterium]
MRYYNYEDFVPAGLVPVACYVCGQSGGREIGVDAGYRIEQCRACDFAFVNPRPDATELGRLYENYYEPDAVVPEKWEREMGDVFDECGDWLGERGRVGTALDIGCSFGHLLLSLERRGWQTTGVEPSPVAAAYAQGLIRGVVHRGGFEDVALEPASFDAVVSLYVLEHVSDPRAFMAKVFDILKPGGEAIIRIPFTRPLFPVNRLLRRPLMYAPMHLNDFSPRAMERLGLSLGFARVEARVGRHRKAHDVVEHAGAAVLGGIGRVVERATRGRVFFPLVGALSYRLFKA